MLKHKLELAVFIATTLYIMNTGILLIGLQVYFMGAVSDARIALLSTVYWIPIIFLSPFWGYIADATGRRKEIVVLNLILLGLVTYLHKILCSYDDILLLRIIAGFFSASYSPIVQAGITYNVSPRMFGERIAIFNVGVATGFLLSCYTVSITLIFFPVMELFTIASLTTLASAVIVLFSPIQSAKTGTNLTARQALATSLSIPLVKHLLAGRGILLVIALTIRHMAIMGLFSLIYVYMQKMGVSSQSLGIISSFNNLTQIILIPVSGMLVDRIGRKRIFVPGFFLSSLIPMFFMRAGTSLEFALSFIFTGIAYSLLISGANTYVRDIAPKGRESEVLSLMNTTRALGMIIGPMMVGFLVEKYNYETMFFSLFLTGIFSTIIASLCTETYKVQKFY